MTPSVRIVEVGPRDGLQNEATLVSTESKLALVDRLAAGLDGIAVFGAASDTFSRRNVDCSVEESLARFAPVAAAARAAGLRVRGYVSCAAGCPYEGAVAPDRVAEVSARLDACAGWIRDLVGRGPRPGRRAPSAAADAPAVSLGS